MADTFGDDFFEVVLKRAVIENNRNEIAVLPSENELAKLCEFSRRHIARMKRLFAADGRREVFTVVYKWGKVAVIAVCVSATLTFGTLLTSAEIRKAVGDVIITWFEKFTKFQSEESDGEFTEREWKPEYLPAGFDATDTLGARGFVYANGEGALIIFEYNPSDSSISVDNEDMDYSIITDNGVPYHLFRTTITDGEHDNVVLWDADGYRFTVMGNYDIDELLRIALSIK
jgi:hypothetical protein